MDEIKIRFKYLSYPLKIAIILAWFIGTIWLVAFLGGVIAGFVLEGV